MSKKHSHYHKNVAHLESIDVYRVLELFGVTNPCLQHAVKKLLCAGVRGVKDQGKDIQEAIDSLQRALEMSNEDKRQEALEGERWITRINFGRSCQGSRQHKLE